MMKMEKSTVASRRRNALLEAPIRQRRPLLSSNTVARGNGGGNGIPSTARSSSFINSPPPVQQPPFVGNSISSVAVETLSTSSLSSRIVDGGSVKTRKCLLTTPVKTKSQDTDRKATFNIMCISCKSNLRLNGRGEYVCGSCGKVQSRASSINALIGAPLLRQASTLSESQEAKAQQCNGESGTQKRRLPGLLELPPNVYRIGNGQPIPVPLMQFPSHLTTSTATTTSSPTSLFTLMTTNRRVLLPPNTTRSDEKPHQLPSLFSMAALRPDGCQSKKQCSTTRSSKRHHPYSRTDYVHGIDLKLMQPSKRSSKIPKLKSILVNNGTTMDLDQDKDLDWLYQQRESIDRRIAQLLEQNSKNSDFQALEGIKYASGYYCYPCRRFLRDDYNSRLAHSIDRVHMANLASSTSKSEICNRETDSVFKYYEEHYECLAFDGDATADDSAANSVPVPIGDACSSATNPSPDYHSSTVNGEDHQCLSPRPNGQADEVDYEELLSRAGQLSPSADRRQSDDEDAMGSLLCKGEDRAWSHLDGIQDQDGTEQNSGSYRDHLRLHLSNGEIRTIQNLWSQLKQMHDNNVGSRVFCELFAQRPELKLVFGLGGTTSLEGAITHPRMIKHTLVFQDTLELVIRSLNTDNDQLSSLLIAFGSQHAYFLRRNFDPTYWMIFGQVLTDLVNDLQVKPYRRKTLARLWFKVMYFVIASIRTGHAIGGASKYLTSSSRRWWKDARRRHSAVENQLIDVLYVTDPVKL